MDLNIPSHFGEMDLNARVDVNFSRVDVNIQTAIVTLFRSRFFHFNINQHQGPINTSYKISAKNTELFWRNWRFYSFDILVTAAILNSQPN